LFWSLTPLEINDHVLAASRRLEREEVSRRWHTWHVAALSGTKKFPSFNDFVKPIKPPTEPRARRQSAADQIAALRGIFSRRKR